MKDVVAEGFGLREDRPAGRLIQKEVEELGEGQVLDQPAKNDAAAGVGDGEVEVCENGVAGRFGSVEGNEGFDLDQSPAAAAVE